MTFEVTDLPLASFQVIIVANRHCMHVRILVFVGEIRNVGYAEVNWPGACRQGHPASFPYRIITHREIAVYLSIPEVLGIIRTKWFAPSTLPITHSLPTTTDHKDTIKSRSPSYTFRDLSSYKHRQDGLFCIKQESWRQPKMGRPSYRKPSQATDSGLSAHHFFPSFKSVIAGFRSTLRYTNADIQETLIKGIIESLLSSRPNFYRLPGLDGEVDGHGGNRISTKIIEQCKRIAKDNGMDPKVVQEIITSTKFKTARGVKRAAPGEAKASPKKAKAEKVKLHEMERMKSEDD